MKDVQGDFIRWSPELRRDFHSWEVLIPKIQDGEPSFREERFTPEEYDAPDKQYDAVCELINGCRMTDTEYFVFCDNKLVTDF